MEVRERHQTCRAGVRKLGLARCSHLRLDLAGPRTICVRVVSANDDVLPVPTPGYRCEFVDLVPVFYGTRGARSQFGLVDGRCRRGCCGFRRLNCLLNTDFVLVVGHITIPTAVNADLRIINSLLATERPSNQAEWPGADGADSIKSRRRAIRAMRHGSVGSAITVIGPTFTVGFCNVIVKSPVPL